MAAAAADDSLLEILQVRLGLEQHVVESGHFLVEQSLGLVSLRRERVESIGEAVVKTGQLRNALGGNTPQLCIFWRRRHLLRSSRTRS